MTGICMSMRIRSKGCLVARSTPIWPFSAVVTSAPALRQDERDQLAVRAAVFDQQDCAAGRRVAAGGPVGVGRASGSSRPGAVEDLDAVQRARCRSSR